MNDSVKDGIALSAGAGVSGFTLCGITLPDWIIILTFTLLLLQLVEKVRKYWKSWKNRGV